ncbi:MAG: hypothetical protein A2015_01830 [Spirochaetes bacterium GWF1_31_7]|nr:MAG: hypothetical protein A2Y30_00780 [Spirochaetes bacterium GWE1_32_154]OHD45947.1 MAG: hypothetical protein A2Y29_16625 [Spirochaetes bacterium GWE2_31_10]OHD48112.1 MAG: hypothetical protein A2015_01830 [Spirochaetes bacterium GWF1_31_7]OHD80414.1 MAG: hypothetical protein A2355_13100 [Spirochaetes bacterium RIFOXYB1_FULL_32_8]HBD95814.1 hypothetical protein [Spirochaetia bacterium]
MKNFGLYLLTILVVAIPSLVFGILYYSNFILEQVGKPIVISLKWVTPLVCIISLAGALYLSRVRQIPSNMTPKSRLIAFFLLWLVFCVYLTWIATGYIAAASTLKVDDYKSQDVTVISKKIKSEPTRSGSYNRYFVTVLVDESRTEKSFEIDDDTYQALQKDSSYQFNLARGRLGYYFYNKKSGLIKKLN